MQQIKCTYIYFMAMKLLSCKLITCFNFLYSFVRIWSVLEEEKYPFPFGNSCILNPKFLLWLSLHVDLEKSEGIDYYSNLSSCLSLSYWKEEPSKIRIIELFFISSRFPLWKGTSCSSPWWYLLALIVCLPFQEKKKKSFFLFYYLYFMFLFPFLVIAGWL